MRATHGVVGWILIRGALAIRKGFLPTCGLRDSSVGAFALWIPLAFVQVWRGVRGSAHGAGVRTNRGAREHIAKP